MKSAARTFGKPRAGDVDTPTFGHRLHGVRNEFYETLYHSITVTFDHERNISEIRHDLKVLILKTRCQFIHGLFHGFAYVVSLGCMHGAGRKIQQSGHAEIEPLALSQDILNSGFDLIVNLCVRDSQLGGTRDGREWISNAMCEGGAHFADGCEPVIAFGDRIVGESEPIQRVRDFITRITTARKRVKSGLAAAAISSKHPPSVLITGETGTGKDLVARAIHYCGPRREGQFVHVNCTAITEQLAESELFGHVKGAFTDARGDKRGLFEVADGGTVFLDEIGHMPISLQAKLLAAVERHQIRPVGGTRERSVDVHVIAATNRDLDEAIELREFREDLYHRIRVLAIHMPPLRERGEDVEILAKYFLERAASRFGVPVSGWTDTAVEALYAYDWPGNVRELLHVVDSAVLVADGDLVNLEHLNIRLPQAGGALALKVPSSKNTITMEFSDQDPKLDEIEHQIIQAALEHAGHNLTRAARYLGIS